ncbi:hypothetical protein K8R47_01630 [archaeon]|nr:hypothetical protein [archaeon]
MDRSELILVKKPGIKQGEYRLKPFIGSRYKFEIRGGDGKEVEAMYFGLEKRYQIFYGQDGGDILKYTRPVDAAVLWECDGDDAGFPVLTANLIGKLKVKPIFNKAILAQ